MADAVQPPEMANSDLAEVKLGPETRLVFSGYLTKKGRFRKVPFARLLAGLNCEFGQDCLSSSSYHDGSSARSYCRIGSEGTWN
jgi:hypothetical protein